VFGGYCNAHYRSGAELAAQRDLDTLRAAHAIKQAPTREALTLSARQWVTAARERMFESQIGGRVPYPLRSHMAYVMSALEKAEAALKELGAE
jgi:hypothetical protein